MSKDFNLKGTINPSFKIGENGATIYQGTSVPDDLVGVAGDAYLLISGNNSALYIKIGPSWSNITTSNINSPTPTLNGFVVGNGSNFVTLVGSDARNAIGLGDSDTVSFGDISLGTISAGTNLVVSLYEDLNLGTITVGNNSTVTDVIGRLNINGTSFKDAVSDEQPSSVLYVSSNGDDSNNGSLTSPVKTISQALSLASTGSQIKILAGSYVEDITVDKEVWLYADQGAVNSYPVTIEGKASFTGTGVIRSTNIQFRNAGTNTTDYAVHVRNVGTPSGFKFEGCSFLRAQVDNDKDAILFDDTDGVWSGSVTINNIPYSVGNIHHSASGYVKITNCQNTWYTSIIVDEEDSVLDVCNGWTFRKVIHSSGKIFLMNIRQIQADVANNNDSIVSTANLPTDVFYFTNSGLVQDNGVTIGRINKTGACPYALTNIVRNPQIDILTGFELDYVKVRASDIGADHLGTNYVGLRNDSVTDHLQSIDSNLETNLSLVTSNDVSSELWVNGSTGNRLSIGTNSAWSYDINVIGKNADASKVFCSNFVGVISRSSGVAGLLPNSASNFESTNCLGTATVDVDTTNNSLRVNVTGEVGETFTWKSKAKIIKL